MVSITGGSRPMNGIRWGAATGMACVAACFGLSRQAHAQATVTALTGTTYSQNFDAMVSGSGASVPAGWGVSGTASPTYATLGTTVTATGSAGGNWTAGGTYVFTSSAGADKSLGFMYSGGYGGPRSVVFGFSNNTGLLITDLSLAFDYEQYRVNTRGMTFNLFSSTDGTNWTSQAFGTQAYTGTASSYPNPPTTVSKTGTLAAVNIATNSNFYLRWDLAATTGSTYSSAPAIGVDNFTMAASLSAGSTDLYWDGSSWGSTSPGTGGSGSWTDGSGAWDSTLTGNFGGTAGTVTAGTVTASRGMVFSTTGYTVTGGTISLSAAAIASNFISTGAGSGITATIDSILTGSTGLTKIGAGTLVLGGANTFSGNLALNAGTLEVASDAALGDAANDVALAGTLKTTASVSLGAGRDLSGGGTLDIAPSTTLTSNGSFNLTSTTLANGGTLDLQGATRSVGNLTFGTAATVNGSGGISATGLTATAVTSGTAVINPAITFTTGDKTVDVGSGGTLLLAGDLSRSGTSGRIQKTGAGTLIASGTNSGGFRLGVSGSTPTNGGTLLLTAAAASGVDQLQLNSGTLVAAGPFTFANGLSIGGRSNGVAVVGGTNAIAFSGSSSFFRGFGTTGELRLDVNNVTTLNGVLGATSGTGSATGVTFGGTGRLILAGDGSAFTDRVVVGSGLTLELANATSLAGATLDTSTGTIAYGVASTSIGGLTGSGTLALPTTSLTAGGNNASTTFSGRLTGAGAFTKSGTGTLTLSGANDYSGATTVQAGRLAVNGSLPQTASVTVAGGGELGGAGSVGSSIAGAGAVGPGNSPGILTAPSVTPSGGLGFNFEITGTAPDFTTASASVNDVLRLTNTSTPLLSLLTGSNAMNIYFDEAQFGTPGRIYQAGIFVDATTVQYGTFLDAVDSATFNYYVRTTGTSFDVTYAGNNYLTLANWNTSQSLGVAVNLGATTVPSAAFAGGTVTNGQIMTFEAVPEPSALALAGIGIAAAGYLVRKRRRTE